MFIVTEFTEKGRIPVYSSISRNKCLNFILDHVDSNHPENFSIMECILDKNESVIDNNDNEKEPNYNLLMKFTVSHNTYFDRTEIEFESTVYKTKEKVGIILIDDIDAYFTRSGCAHGYVVFDYITPNSLIEEKISIESKIESDVQKFVLNKIMARIKSALITDMRHTYRQPFSINNNY